MADMNKIVTLMPINILVYDLQLKEIITEVHGNSTAIYHCSSIPIDGIFVSESTHVLSRLMTMGIYTLFIFCQTTVFCGLTYQNVHSWVFISLTYSHPSQKKCNTATLELLPPPPNRMNSTTKNTSPSKRSILSTYFNIPNGR